MPALSPLWLFLDRFVLIVIFITATYNNFVAKAVYMTLIYRVGIPMGLRFKTEGPQKVIGEFAAIGPTFKSNRLLSGASATGLLIGFIGAGAFISNFMTRNNSIDKVAVSIAIAVSLFKALSDGPKSIPFMTGRVVMKDLFVAMKKPSPVRNHHIYVAVFGLACGFLCCLILAWLRKPLGDSIGYILGTIAMIAGAGIAVSQAKGTGKN
jgi:hypothetical protein